MVAVLLLSMTAAAAIAGWQISNQAVVDRRATEMGVFIAASELERLKGTTYDYLSDGGPYIDIYDKYGTWQGSFVSPNYYDTQGNSLGTTAPAGFTYQAKYTLSTVVPSTPTGSTQDLRQIYIEVWTKSGSSGGVKLETVQTLLTFGGI
jgi:hypothetical protein